MACLQNSANLFEKASIDEAYLDVTENVGGDWDAALALAKHLQQQIVEEVNLTASFGIGPTRLVAKMASEVNKPNGIFRVMPDEVNAFFEGRSARHRVLVPNGQCNTEWGYTTADELYALGELTLSSLAGERFATWFMRVVDESSSVVSPLRSRKSSGKSTFERDVENHEVVLERLEELVSLSWNGPQTLVFRVVWLR